MAFGPVSALEHARRARNWDQGQLSKRSGVHRSTISRAESGLIPSWSARAKLAAALQVTVDDLWPTNDNARGMTPRAQSRAEIGSALPTSRK